MNVLILHGSYGKPFENWFPWLESQLSDLGIDCVVPTFPTPNYQCYSDWATLLDYYNRKGYLNNDTIVIGHSCGSIFAVKYIIDRNIHLKGIVTVSGYNNFKSGDSTMDALNETFYRPRNGINRITTLTDLRYSFYSDNDPFIPITTLEEFAHDIDAQMIMVSNAGHFNASSGFTTFEQLLDLLKSIN